MQAIFIDAVNRTVTEIQIENDLHAFYGKIVCKMIQMLDLSENHVCLVDEEGKLRDWKAGFRLAGSLTLAGNALIVGTTDDGDFTDCRAPLCLFSRNVEFIDLRAHPLPPPRFVAVPIKGDITTENIEKAKGEAIRQLEDYHVPSAILTSWLHLSERLSYNHWSPIQRYLCPPSN